MRLRVATVGLLLLAVLLGATGAEAGPGSGIAAILPSTDVTVGTSGTWSVTYTAAESFKDGMIRLTIPAGWTAPQDNSSPNPGYVTVSTNDADATVALDVVGNVIDADVDTLTVGSTVTIVYGDDSGGSKPGARATAPTVPGTADFLVASHPTSQTGPSPIATSPSLTVIAGTIVELVYTSSPFTFASTSEAGPLTVEARDAYGNPSPVLSGQQIDLESTSSGGTFSELGGGSWSTVTDVTMSLGTSSVSFYYRDTDVGTPNLTASAVGQTWTNAVQQQTVSPGPPFSLEILPNDTTVTAGDFAPYTIVVLDANGNRAPVSQTRTILLLASHGTFYLPSNHGTPIATVQIPASEESTKVDYWGTNANGGVAHTLTMFTNDGYAPVLIGLESVTVAAGPLSTSTSTVEATSPVLANGSAQSDVTITVNDTYGNPVQGVDVNLSVTGDAVKADPGSLTGSDGQTTGAVTNTTAETVIVSATADGQGITDDAEIEFIAGDVDADSSTITATSPITADGVMFSTITITAKDDKGNPVAGKSATLSVAPPGNGLILIQPGGLTDSNGQIEGSFVASTTTGDRVVSVVIDGVPVAGTATITFVPGPAASFEWAVGGTGTAGVAVQPVLTVYDGEGNVVTNYTGTVDLSTTSLSTGDGVVEWSDADANGTITNLTGDQATYAFSALDNGSADLRVTDQLMESIQLIAQAGAATGTSGNIVINHNIATQIEIVEGNGQSAVVNTNVTAPPNTPPKVRVRDSYGNAVDNQTVTFRLIEGSGGGSLDVVAGGAPDSTALTDVSGEVDCDVWTLGQTAGTNIVRAFFVGGGSPSVNFTANGTPGVGANILITPPSQNVTVGSDVVVTATLRDQFNNIVTAGERVDILIHEPVDGQLSQNAGDPNPTYGSTTQRWGITDSDGQITVEYNAPSTTGLSDNVDAFTTSVPEGSVVDAVYTTVTGEATVLRLTLASPTAQAGSSFSFLIEAVDNNGNLYPSNTSTVNIARETGSGLLFSETDFGTPTTQVTLVGGQKTVYGLGDVVGDWDITVTDDAAALGPDTKTISIQDAGVIDHYHVTTVDSVIAGNGFNVTVEARDAFNNRVMTANNVVYLVAVDGASLIVETDTLLVGQAPLSSGLAVVGESYRRSGDIRVRVRDASANEGYSGVIKVKPAGAYRIEKVSGDITGIPAGAGQTLVAKVLDEYDNPVAGEDVTFVVTGGGGTVAPGSASTGSNGQASTVLTTGPAAGANGVKATIGDANPAGLERIDYLVTTVADVISMYKVTPQKTTITAGETINVEVGAYDVYDNLVVGDNTTVVELSSTGNATFGSSVGTLTGGVYTTTVSDTVAELMVVTVTTQGVPAPNGASPLITVTNAAAYQIEEVRGDTTGVTVGATRDLTVRVRDPYGNAVPGAFVTFTITGNPDGSASLTQDIVTTGSPGGRATTTLQTALAAGDNVVDAIIYDGTPARERVTFVVSAVAGEIDHYEVLTDVTQQTAGVAVNVTVRALDASNNLVDDSSTPVLLTLDPGTGPIWGGGANPGLLVAGTLQRTVTVNQVQTYNVRASTDGDPTTTGLGPAVTIVPDVPAGTITGTADPATITANGLKTSNITTSVITDQFGNQVPEGELVTVTTDLGSIDSPDHDGGIPGNQQEVKADGTVEVTIRSGTTAGIANVDFQSVNGTASGTVNVTFAEIPDFACNNPPDPNSVIVGQTVSFQVDVENTSTTGVMLTGATSFSFTDVAHTYTSSLSAPTYVAGGNTGTLTFNAAQVHADMEPAKYQPEVSFVGTDDYGSAYSGDCLLPINSLLVSAIEITGISAPLTMSRGRTDTVTVTIDNPTPANVTIQTVTLSFGGGSYNQDSSLDLPLVITQLTSGTVRVLVEVLPSSATGTFEINAAASGIVDGNPVVDNSLAPYPLPTWTITTAADVDYVAGTLDPLIVTRGKTYQLTVGLENSGEATLTLDTASTVLSFTDGVDTYTTTPAQNVALPGESSQLILFKPRAVPAGMDLLSNYNVQIAVNGLENGAPFSKNVFTSPKGDFLTVVSGAVITAQPGTLTPTTVSKGSSVAFEVQVYNSGGASVQLTPSQTTFAFAGGLYSATLDDNYATTIVPLGYTTLTFNNAGVSGSIASLAYTPTVEIRGTENGLTFTQTVPLTDQVTVQDAPVISIQSIRPSQERITADQTAGIGVWMKVKNSGQATVRFDAADIRFILGGSDKTGEFNIVDPGAFTGGINLAGGATDSLLFLVSDNAGNSMSAGVMTIEGDLWVTDLNPPPTQIHADTDLGGKGRLVVQTRAQLVVEKITSTQDPVTVGQTKGFRFKMAVRNSGGSDVRLAMSADSTLVSFSPSAGGWGWSLQGTLAGGGDILSGGERDTVVFDVGVAGAIPGTIQLNGTVQGEEINSGRNVVGSSGGVGAGSILVQSEAALSITNVRPSRQTITTGTNVLWKIWMDVSNTGQSEIDLTLSDSLLVSITGQSTPSTFVLPPTLVGRGTTLGGGESGELEVQVVQTGAFSSFGAQSIDVHLAGVETNSERRVEDDATGTVTVQLPAFPEYVTDSLDPSVVSKGSTVEFDVVVRNPLLPSATMHLDRAQTRLRFGGGLFDVGLKPSSPDSIPGGQTRTLAFNGQVVNTSITSGPKTVQVDLHWIENGADNASLLTLPSDQLTVQDAGALQVVSIHPSQPTVTRSQPKDWWITMVLQNNGEAGVILDLLDTSTYLTLEPLSGPPVTGEYTIDQPAELEWAGSTTLPGGEVDSLVFNVRQTGTTIGPIRIAGQVEGVDENSVPVSDNTFDGGAGSFTVQTATNLSVVGITPQQSTATAGQTTPYVIDMVVENLGDADARLALHADSTRIFFSDLDPNWQWDVQSTLVEGGVVLGGRQRGTIVFTVRRTGLTTGTPSISAIVQGIELNSDVLKVGTGSDLASIEVQTAGEVVFTDVSLSRPTVTQSSGADWTITATFDNGGDAEMVFVPESLAVSIADAVSGTQFVYPTELESGTTLIGGGAVGEKVKISVANTGLFSSAGPKQIAVRLVARESNSLLIRSDVDTTAIVTVQNPPALEYVPLSLNPSVATSGAGASFEIEVANENSDNATARLNPSSVFRFAGGQYTALLSPSSQDSIPGGDSVVVTFEKKTVNPLIPPVSYPVSVDLDYSHNGNEEGAEPLSVSDSVRVEAPPTLSIVSIESSQPTVTADQPRRWFIDMVVQNNGDPEANVIVNMSKPGTSLFLDHFTAGDVTDHYTIDPPESLQVAGSDTLRGGGAIDTLRFVVRTTDSVTGNIRIEGRVEGEDENSHEILSDSTFFSGAGGRVVVQTPAELSVKNVTSSQPTVTEGQTTDWIVTVELENSGEAALDIEAALSRLEFNGDPDWLYDPPSALVGGDTVLYGGGTGSLKFVVDSTGTRGTQAIKAAVTGIELNSGDVRADSAFGGVVVQTPPNLRFLSTNVVAPNGPTVNVDQVFRLAVEIENQGEARANFVNYDIAARNGSLPSEAQRPISGIPGGTIGVDTLDVQAAPSARLDTLAVTITSALDANSLQPDLVVFAQPFDSVEVAIQEEAVLRIDSVLASQSSVTRLQREDWYVTVYFTNTGGADLVLDDPSASDLRFFLGLLEQTDYAVVPPDTLESGGTAWVIPGDSSDALQYTVDRTGDATGTVKAQVDVRATDVNDGSPLFGSGAVFVDVEEPSGVFVQSTVSGALNQSDGISYVNTDQTFPIVVAVKNTGTAVKNVGISLTYNHSATVIPPDTVVSLIGTAATAICTFTVQAQDTPVAPQTFQAVIDSARSVNTNQPVLPSLPLDDDEIVFVQSPALLELTFEITSPPSVSGDTLSTNQTFDVTATVTNLGQAQLDPATSGSGIVSVSLPPGFGFVSPSGPNQSLVLDKAITWKLTAPSVPGTPYLKSTISAVPNDNNTKATAAVTPDTAFIHTTVLQGGDFTDDAIEITSPYGARDDTVSTDQTFRVRATVRATPTVADLSAEILLSGGMQAIGGSTRDLGDGDGRAKVDSFTVQVPSDPGTGEVYVRFSGRDVNTNLPVETTTGPIDVTIVGKTRLSISARISGPPEARDSSVTIGSTFYLEATVLNAGDAGIDPSSNPRVTILLPAGKGYTLVGTAIQPFAVGVPVEWEIQAPNRPSSAPPDVFTMRIVPDPNDENSNAAATIDLRQETIPMITEGASVRMSDATAALGIETKVVPGGTSNVDMFAFELTYAVTDTTVSNAEIDTVAVTVLGEDDKPLSVSKLRRALSQLYVDIGGERMYAADLTANPVAVRVRNAPNLLAVIEPNESATLAVGVSVRSNPAVNEIRLSIAGANDVDVVSSESGQRLGVTDAVTGQPIDGRFKSPPLVILSDSFEEYTHNYPNPFRAGDETTKIAYFLDRPGNVEIKIYSLTGTLVYEEKTSISGIPTGRKTALEAEWDGRNMKGEVVRNGIYVCVINAGSNSARFRIAVAK